MKKVFNENIPNKRQFTKREPIIQTPKKKSLYRTSPSGSISEPFSRTISPLPPLLPPPLRP